MEAFIEHSKVDKPKLLFTIRQCLLAFTGILQGICGGSVLAFSSILLPQLQESQEVVLTIDEASWIASIPTLALLPVVLSIGWFMRILGRRRTLLCAFLVTFIAWLTMHFAKSYATLAVGRALGGVFIAAFYSVAVTFIGEATQPSIRAACLAAIPLGSALGVLLTQLAGVYVHWRHLALFLCTLPLASLVIVYNMPESHIWLLNKNRVTEARRAFVWFRGDDERAIAEFLAAMETNDNGVATSSCAAKMAFCTSKAFVMPFLLTALLYLTCEFSGDTALIFYTAQIIAVITAEPRTQFYANLALNVLRVLATITSAMLTKRFSVRQVLLSTGFALACSLAAIALFLHLSAVFPEQRAFPIACVVAVVVNVLFFALGLGPLPTVICGEVYPAAVRDLGAALSAFLAFSSLFVLVKFMPHLFLLVQPAYIFLMFACCTFTGVTIMCFVLPNTRNKTLKQLETFYEA